MALGFTRFWQWMNNIQNFDFLPPANEFWGKVMFLHVSVSHSVHMGVSVWCHFLSGCLVTCPFWGSLSLVPCSFWGSLSLVPCPLWGSLFGGLCLGRSLSGGLCPRVSVKGVSVQGVSVEKGSLPRKGLCQGDPPPIQWRVGGTHPTGMLSFLHLISAAHCVVGRRASPALYAI